jgi:hypothetical protein
MGMGAVAAMAFVLSGPVLAGDVQVANIAPVQITSAQLSPQLDAPTGNMGLRPSYSQQPALTNDLLAAYVRKQQALKSVNVEALQPGGELTEQVLLGYIERKQGLSNGALDAIDSIAEKPSLNADILENYAQKKFVPTVKKVKLSASEKLCLTQAIYHEARGESQEGQWAVANVIINRAMSHKFPATLCGVVFQNADAGFHHCQFTFACDGKSDMGTEHSAWVKASKMAQVAYNEYQQGERPGVVPASALYYHTTSVNPSWSDKFKRVAAIGAHVFYAGR